MRRTIILLLISMLIAGAVTNFRGFANTNSSEKNASIKSASIKSASRESTSIESTSSESTSTQKSIAKKILRFHVLAASDSAEDQELKLKVKNAVISYVARLTKDSDNLSTTTRLIQSHKKEILEIARKVIKENGYTYDVSASIETSYFPIKTYSSLTFPPGKYRSFTLRIGEAKGKNWWCVLYPPLCFVDAVHCSSTCEKEMQEVLTPEEYQSLLYNSEEEKSIHYEFRIFKFMNQFLE